MKINLILPALGHSGGVQMATDYLNYFANQNNNVTCYVPFTGAYYGWKKFLFFKSIYRILRSEDLQGKWILHDFTIKFVPYINNIYIRNADVTIATSWLTSYWVYRLKPQKGAKVYFIQDFETWGTNKENKKVKKSYQLPYDLRISVSTELHNRLKNEINANSCVICNGIPEKYILKTRKHIEGKITIGIPYREKRSVKQDIKNTAFGIKSLLEFQQENPSIKLKTFGFKKPQNFPHEIMFLENPSRAELTKWYDSVDIFYVPSLYEGWGLPAMEAMARGCVVIGANTGCLSEYGKHMVNCYKLRNMQSKKELYTALRYFLNADETVIQDISKNAVEIVKNYSFENEAQKFLNSLDNVISSAKKH